MKILFGAQIFVKKTTKTKTSHNLKMPGKRHQRSSSNDIENPLPTFSTIPDELVLQIFKWIDEDTLRHTRLVSKRFSELSAPIYFGMFEFSLQKLKQVPQHLSHLSRYVKRICFNSNDPSDDIEQTLREHSATLKYVVLFTEGLTTVLKELAKCRNLEDLVLYVHGKKNHWESVLERVFYDGHNQHCFAKVRSLFINLPGHDSSQVSFAQLGPLFPNVERLIIRGGDFVPKAIPSKVKSLKMMFHPDKNDRCRKVDLTSLLPRLPLLTSIYIQSNKLVLPTDPTPNVTEFSFSTSYKPMSIHEFGEAFPNLHELNLYSEEGGFSIRKINKDLAKNLRSLTIKAENGPVMPRLLKAFPNVTEMELFYDNRMKMKMNAETQVPLADFGKLKKLSICSLTCKNVKVLRWFEDSIRQSFKADTRNEFQFEFCVRDVDYEHEDMLVLIENVSKVVNSMKLYVFADSFEPEWLDLISGNLVILDMQFRMYSFFAHSDSDIDVKKFEDFDEWRQAINRLRQRGVTVAGQLQDFLC